MSDKEYCLRCGHCCRSYIVIIPKDKNSDLSPEFLESYQKQHGQKALREYIDKNHTIYASKCKYLEQERYSNVDGFPHSTSSCSVYSNRSSCCREYSGQNRCLIGLRTWQLHKIEGHEIPKEIQETIKEQYNIEL